MILWRGVTGQFACSVTSDVRTLYVGAKRSFIRQQRLVTDKEWHRTLSAAADVPRPMGENRAKFSVSQLEFCSLALQVTLNLRIWHQDRGDKSDGAHKSDVPIKAGFRATVLEPERNILC